ncbi:MAG: inorganic phosphate transporter, partial [Acinetobacter sp.]|nr:inorganic phosphate transporter [Acinetobacter sp.]
MKLKDIQQLERAQSKSNIERYRLGIGLLLILGIMIYVNSVIAAELNLMLILAAVIGGYMAMNIGANDVANNVGPAVGSRAMTLTTALFIAAIFEA